MQTEVLETKGLIKSYGTKHAGKMMNDVSPGD